MLRRAACSLVWRATSRERGVHNKAASITDVSVFLDEIAVSQAPKRLPALVRVLEAQGAKVVGPIDRHGLHPLLVPVVSGGAAASPDTITCLLRWPQPSKYKNMQMPVVSMQRGARSVQLLARSVDEYLHRQLAEEDLRVEQQSGGGDSGERMLAAAAGPEGWPIYQAGKAASEGFSGAQAKLYVVRKAGHFPDVCEALAHGHLSRGDMTSALVASEYYMRNNFFPGWARPYEFGAELLAPLERVEEARDIARVALRLPWWTLGRPVSEVQALAQLQGKTPEELKYALSEEAAAAAQAHAAGARRGVALPQEPKSPQQVALERAETLLDLVAAGALPSYEDVRAELSEAYRDAGLVDMANFIIAAS